MTTWTEAGEEQEAWTDRATPVRIFDPFVFDNAPIFDTGSPAGVWRTREIQSEQWVIA